MGHPYRERHDVASTTTDNLTGLGAGAPKTGNASWTDENTLAELQDAARKAALPTYGTKAELIARLKDNK